MSRKEISIDSSVQIALSKLLAKANLIKHEDIPENWADDTMCPIAHFAHVGKFDEKTALKIVAERLAIPTLQVSNANAETLILTLSDSRFSNIDFTTWKNMRAIPVIHLNGSYSIAMANPLDLYSKHGIEIQLGKSAGTMLCSEEQVLRILAKQLDSKSSFQIDTLINQATSSIASSEFTLERADRDQSIFGEDLESPPVIRLVNKILAEAVAHNASDIHIEPERSDLAVRIRVDGIMYPLFIIPPNLQNPVISRIKLLSSIDIAEKRRPQDGRFRIKSSFGMKDLRVSTIPTIYGENLVIRILSSDLNKLEFRSLGFNPEIESSFKRILHETSKVILVTGPTGSGKTSTLYTSLLNLRDGTRNIITVEDPIEYRIVGVNQIQINQKVGLTFAESLRSVLRQDPDVVMVGEIRDQETATIAMQVAQTGHLVLSTLHTNSAASAITRLADIGVPHYIIASSVGAIMAQRLVRKLCNHCRIPLSHEELKHASALGLSGTNVYKAGSCKECHKSGYSGRVGIYSLLEITEEILEAIRANASEEEIEQIAKKTGFRNIPDAGRDAIQEGKTSIDEVQRVIGPLKVLHDNTEITVIKHEETIESTHLTRRIRL